MPFFFIISGYFWGLKVRNGDYPIAAANRVAKRIGLIFLAWCIIYVLPYNLSSYYENGVIGAIQAAYWNILHIAQHPTRLLMQGTKFHLWFLVSLLFSLYITSIFLLRDQLKSLIIFSIVLYVFGVMAKAYSCTSIGIGIEINTRNGPFFGTLPFVTGYIISSMVADPKWLKYGCLLYFLGTVLHFSEIFVLWKCFSITPIHDYVFATYFMGLGVALISLSSHPVLHNKYLSSIGKMTLGIYAVHFIFVDNIQIIDQKIHSPVWEIGKVLLVLILSVISTWLLSKNRLMRKVVI